LNFALAARLPSFGPVSFGVACGRGLAEFERVMANELPPGFGVSDIREVAFRGRRLATAQVSARQPVGMAAAKSRWVGWESKGACVTTSRKGATHDDMVALIARTPMHESAAAPGVVFDTPLDNSESPVRGATFLPFVGVLEVRPRVPEVNELLPARRGAGVDGGELFRVGRRSQTFLLVGESAAAWIRPVGRTAAQVLGFASTLKVAWEAA
jgi:hypothetical protein